MQKFSAAALVLIALPAFAQQPIAPSASLPNSPGWTRVEALPASTSFHIDASGHSSSCKLKIADDNSVTCVSHDGAKTDIFQRSDIRKIVVPHRGRSTLIGLGIGAGFGLILGAASGSNCTPQSFICFSRGDLAAVGAVVFAPIGALVGALTDFSRTTIYRAP